MWPRDAATRSLSSMTSRYDHYTTYYYYLDLLKHLANKTANQTQLPRPHGAGVPLDGVPDPRLPLRRHPPLHLRRHWRRRPVDVDHPRQPARPGRRVPLCGLALGPVWPPLHCPPGRLLQRPRHGRRLDRAHHEHRHWRHGLCGHRRRHQRADGPRRRLRDVARRPARQVHERPRLHHCALLPVGPLRPAHCRLRLVALRRPVLRPVEPRRLGHDGRLLLSPAACQPAPHDQAGDSGADGPDGRVSEHRRLDSLLYVSFLLLSLDPNQSCL